jgi:hypothetical protein
VGACLAGLGAHASIALSTSHQLVTAEAIPIPLVPAPSGGGVGWGRVWRHWERTPPVRSLPAPACHHLGAHASGALTTCYQLVTAGAIPILLVPAHSGGEVGWGRVWRDWERTPPAHSPPATSSRQREPSGTAGSRPQRGRGRVGACLAALGAHASGALATCTSLPSPGSARLRRTHHLLPARDSGSHSDTAGSRPQRRRGRVGACLAGLGAHASGALTTCHQLATAGAIRYRWFPPPAGAG